MIKLNQQETEPRRISRREFFKLASLFLIVTACEQLPIPEPTPGPTETSLPTATVTPAPKDPTKSPESTPTQIPVPTPEIAPSNEICAIGELAGNCYQRTEMRTGVFLDGHVEPDGTVARYIPDPDIRVSGGWMVGGRVVRIELPDIVYVKGRGGDVLKIRIAYDSPYFYSRMQRWVFNVPW